MNQKNSMIAHIRLDPETHKQMKHICVDRSISIQEFIYEAVKDAIKNRDK